MKFGSLFAGIGGFDLGLGRAGMKCAWQVEIDPKCREVLRRHWPNVPCHEDVTKTHSNANLTRRVMIEYLQGEPTTEAIVGQLKKLTPEQVEQSVRMYRAGLSLGDIGDYFSVSRQAMWDLLRRRTEMRPQKRYGSDNHFYRGGVKADDAAQNVVEKAVQRGAITRSTSCEECGVEPEPMADGRSAIQAHHDDYNRPLDVRWLCQGCHHEWHKHHKARERTVLSGLDAVDVICGGFP